VSAGTPSGAPSPAPAAPVACPGDSNPASVVGAGARQPINAHLFSADQLADAQRVEDLLRNALAIVTPSNINLWRGHRAPGQTFTAQQVRAMLVAGIEPEAVETVYVSSAVHDRELWSPKGQKAPRLIFTCPVLDRRDGGKLQVLSAAGSKAWVYEDGTITKARPHG